MTNQADLVMSSWIGERRERVEDDTKIEPRSFVTEGTNIRAIDRESEET